MKKLRAIADDTLKGVTKAAKEGLKNNPEFRKLEKRVERLLNETSSGADRHPKLRTMKDLVSSTLNELLSKICAHIKLSYLPRLSNISNTRITQQMSPANLLSHVVWFSAPSETVLPRSSYVCR